MDEGLDGWGGVLVYGGVIRGTVREWERRCVNLRDGEEGGGKVRGMEGWREEWRDGEMNGGMER